MSTATLFDPPQDAPERPADFWEFLEDYCRRVTGKPTWKLYCIERVVGGTLCDGCVPTATYKTGPKKGKPKYDAKVSNKIILSDQEKDAEQRRYSETTGRCYGCFGRATRSTGGGMADGKFVEYPRRPCPDCKGTGKYQGVVV